MGCYTYLSKELLEKYSTVKDEAINIVLQEVRSIEPIWYVRKMEIEERKGVFRKPVTRIAYTLFESQDENKNYSEVYYQSSVNSKRDLLNFLYGLNIGLHRKP